MTSQTVAPPVALPRVRSVPSYSFTSGVEAVEMAESIGLQPDPWQTAAVYDMLAEDSRGKWATFESAAIVPRQNGKGSILEVIDLADLFIFGTAQRDFLAIHTAHEFKTAQEAFRRVKFWVDNIDWMRKKVARISTSHGEEGIELLGGQRLRFLARSNGSGRGFSCDRLTYDEAYDLPEETVAASMPTLSARPNPSIIYTSSAPLDHAKSAYLRRVMRRGRQEPGAKDEPVPEMDPNLCYLEFSADPKADLDDEAAWIQANPGSLSGRITVEFIAKERAAMSEVSFARERLGILDESKGAQVIDPVLWEAAGDQLSTPLDPVAFAIDVNPDSSRATIAVAGKRADGRTHVEVVDSRRGTGWVANRLAELVERWKVTDVVLDKIGPAAALLPQLAEVGIDPYVVNTGEYGQACQGFKAAIDDDRLRHKAQPGLTAALESARKRPLGDTGAWGWHRRDTTDITPLVACTLAAFGLSKGSVQVDRRVIIF